MESVGLELARVFAAHGFDLAIVARRAAELEALVARCRSEQKVRCVRTNSGLPTPRERSDERLR